ncbi:MAG TPA: 2-(1,2-epoxy-1,2-dihydrophenyl)acetyl-CoA isomerase, partial [Hyphomonas atlantica]|nr:2-(1,2-epoxy-1,2-dihydrophenyl)acetyl-CoA isomerase [Hyphomonas atlantica]
WLLARTIGRVRAMEMALFGDKVPAEKALEWGMVNRIVADDALMSTAMEMAEKLATGPTIALSLARDLIWKACESDFDEAIYDERIAQRTAGRTDDFKEGVSAFLQKRPAEFKGK